MKIYVVDGVHGSTLVNASSNRAAAKTVVEIVRDSLLVRVASPQDIYDAGKRGVIIIGADAPEADPEPGQ